MQTLETGLQVEYRSLAKRGKAALIIWLIIVDYRCCVQLVYQLYKFEISMSEQQLATVQQYIAMLFDDLPQINANLQHCSPEVVKLLTAYGRKIIDLSQQSTFKYRNQHFLPRAQVQQQLSSIYRLVVGEEPDCDYDKLVPAIILKLQQDRKSIWVKHSLPESRLIPVSEFKTEDPHTKVALEEERNSLKPSRTKSKARGSRITTVKEALQVRGWFQEEEVAIRQFFHKVSKLLEFNKVPVSSLQPSHLKFSRCTSQNTAEKITDLIKTSTHDHTTNINNLCHLVQLLHDNLQKRLRNQGTSNAKFEAYLDEVKRMEEVYSYTLSKLLQNLSTAKNLIRQDPSMCLQQLKSLQEITQKMYGLFPSSDSLQNISASARGARQTRSFGVQANITKGNSEKKTGTETFRLQVKMNQMLDRFQRGIKFRKTIEIKQIDKLFQSLRELVPVSKQVPLQDTSYQEEFRKVVDLQDKRQKELIEAHNKKARKLEKRIAELEQLIQDKDKELNKIVQHHEHEQKKLQKKIDTQQSEYKKLANQKGHLQMNLSEMLKEIEIMREAVRRQGNEETFQRMQLERQKQQLAEKLTSATQKSTENQEELKQQRVRMNEERIVFKQKIQLTEKQLQEQKQLTVGLRLQLETVINEHHSLKIKLKEMTVIYEEKIKEVEEMIENIHELEDIKKQQETTIHKLNQTVQILQQQLETQNKEIQQYLHTIEHLSKDNAHLKTEVDKWKEEGKLTDFDLKALKEEVDKVNAAYLDSEVILESTRQELVHSNEEREKLFRQKIRLGRQVEDLQSQLHSMKTRQQALQLTQRDMKDEFYQKCQQISRLAREGEEMKRELLKAKKELNEEREGRAKIDKELREIRQELQSKRDVESAQKGKHRLQLENMRVELRRKTQQLQKQRDAYEQRIGIMNQRIQQMEQVMGQKQLLSRLLQHQTQ